MKTAAAFAVLALMARAAFAGPSDPSPEKDDFATVTLHDGLTIGLGMLRLGGDDEQPVPLEGELLGRANIATRLIIDENSGATFGYRIEAMSVSPTAGVLVSILPLDSSDEQSLRRLKVCRTCPALRIVATSIRYPPRTLVREGDTMVIDLLERPKTQEKIVDVVKFGSGVELAREDLDDIRRRVRQAARHVRKGDELAGRGACEDAIAEYRKAVALQRDAATYRRLGRCQHQLGRIQAAQADFGKALHIQDGDAETRRDLATTYLDIGNVDRAVKEYRRAYVADAKILDAPGVKAKNVGLQQYVFAKVYMAERKHEAALAALEKATDSGFADLEAMKSDPAFAPLRQNPRFVGLVSRGARS
jgi:hypothetical protein